MKNGGKVKVHLDRGRRNNSWIRVCFAYDLRNKSTLTRVRQATDRGCRGIDLHRWADDGSQMIVGKEDDYYARGIRKMQRESI